MSLTIGTISGTQRVVIRVGCDMTLVVPTDTVALLTVKPLPDPHRIVLDEKLQFDSFVEPQMFNDYFGNIVHRVNLPLILAPYDCLHASPLG